MGLPIDFQASDCLNLGSTALFTFYLSLLVSYKATIMAMLDPEKFNLTTETVQRF